MPVEEPTAAIVALLLIHEPPAVASARVVVVPGHKVSVPVIADGNGSTVLTEVAIQPVPNEYVIITVPALTPVSTPVLLTVAIVASLLLHAPPGVAVVSVTVKPTHTLAVDGAPGSVFTVTITQREQPVGML
jgi:hypothetical protein